MLYLNTQQEMKHQGKRTEFMNFKVFSRETEFARDSINYNLSLN